MKKLLVVLLTVSVCNMAVSQEFNFGIKGGVNFVSPVGDTSGLESLLNFGIILIVMFLIP